MKPIYSLTCFPRYMLASVSVLQDKFGRIFDKCLDSIALLPSFTLGQPIFKDYQLLNAALVMHVLALLVCQVF